MCYLVVFFFKQKTAYEMRISDWSSDVCSSDLEVGIGVATGRYVAPVVELDGEVQGAALGEGHEVPPRRVGSRVFVTSFTCRRDNLGGRRARVAAFGHRTVGALMPARTSFTRRR